ncbi:hypothetical protein Fcan01_13212 [Folsomia candida]|uniref:Uncharacterized protein n=1 Tax=Folsomia candida TaxID=158441 RepID=A0A226E301_FOLCA|nr:hypothetical protein Fcan01_13212 [Folsomia candida]
MSVKGHHRNYSTRSSTVIRDQNLPTQRQLDGLEIRFNNCVITYKLPHIETQASKYRWRKVGKSLGYIFPSLRVNFSESSMFRNCLFNPSDRSIVHEHLKNLETPTIRFINCKFLRRDCRFSEALVRSWRRYRGELVKFVGKRGFADVDGEIIRLKDLPKTIEYIIVHGKDVVA